MDIRITKSNFVDFIRANVNGTSAITVKLNRNMDDTNMRKTNNPYSGCGIVKKELLNGIIGYIYSDSVNRIAIKEDKELRNAKPHPWGDMDSKHLFRIHRKTGKHYLSMRLTNANVIGFFKQNGEQIDENTIRPFIPEKKKSSTQEDLNGEVIALDYNLDNIEYINAFGNKFVLCD